MIIGKNATHVQFWCRSGTRLPSKSPSTASKTVKFLKKSSGEREIHSYRKRGRERERVRMEGAEGRGKVESGESQREGGRGEARGEGKGRERKEDKDRKSGGK